MERNSFSKFESGIKVAINNNASDISKAVFTPKSVPEEKGEFKKNIFDKIILVSFFMLFFGLPIFFTGLSFQGVVFEKQIYFYFIQLTINIQTFLFVNGKTIVQRTCCRFLIVQNIEHCPRKCFFIKNIFLSNEVFWLCSFLMFSIILLYYPNFIFMKTQSQKREILKVKFSIKNFKIVLVWIFSKTSLLLHCLVVCPVH